MGTAVWRSEDNLQTPSHGPVPLVKPWLLGVGSVVGVLTPSLLAGPLIFFFFSDTGSHFVAKMLAVHDSPPTSDSPVLGLQTALAYVFSSV